MPLAHQSFCHGLDLVEFDLGMAVGCVVIAKGTDSHAGDAYPLSSWLPQNRMPGISGASGLWPLLALSEKLAFGDPAKFADFLITRSP